MAALQYIVKRLIPRSLAVLAASSGLVARPALSAPNVYSNYVRGVTSLGECLSRTKRTAKSLGFVVNVQVASFSRGGGGDFYADHVSNSMAVNVHCNALDGIASIGIAGVNNDSAYSMMRQFYDQF